MANHDPQRELALLVNSDYPLIFLETWEESRASEILGLVAEELAVPLYVWSVTTGLSRAGGIPHLQLAGTSPGVSHHRYPRRRRALPSEGLSQVLGPGRDRAEVA